MPLYNFNNQGPFFSGGSLAHELQSYRKFSNLAAIVGGQDQLPLSTAINDAPRWSLDIFSGENMGKFRIILSPFSVGLQRISNFEERKLYFGSHHGEDSQKWIIGSWNHTYIEENTFVSINKLMYLQQFQRNRLQQFQSLFGGLPLGYGAKPWKKKSLPPIKANLFFVHSFFAGAQPAQPPTNSSCARHLIKNMAHPLLIYASQSTSQIIWEHFKNW